MNTLCRKLQFFITKYEYFAYFLNILHSTSHRKLKIDTRQTTIHMFVKTETDAVVNSQTAENNTEQQINRVLFHSPRLSWFQIATKKR